MDSQFDEADVDSVKGCAVLKFHSPLVAGVAVRKPVVGAIAGLVALSVVWGGVAQADPPQDGLAQINELSRQVEQLSDTIRNAQPDLDAKLQSLSQADKKHADDLARFEATKAQLDTYQQDVDQYAAAAYMGGRTDGVSAILTASSPANLIDTLAVQRVVATEISEQMRGFRQAYQEAQAIEEASSKSAADAKAAVDAAAAVRADLQNMRARLRKQMAAVTATYAALPPAQQAGVVLPTAAVTAALGPIAPIPTVGMSGLVPNARAIVDYIMATYPGVKSIGGVRADRLPDHPSGHAVDIMIGSDMSLGDEIKADLESQAGRFGISYTMWRVAAHFDHVHVTVS